MTTPELDPYLRWERRKAAGLAPPQRPVLFEFASGFDAYGDTRLAPCLQAAYRRSGAPSRFATGWVDDALLDMLAIPAYAGKIVRVVSGQRRYTPPQWPSGGLEQGRPLAGAPGRTVVAVVDDGCAFAHERFRRRTPGGRWHSRIAWLWNQADGVNPTQAPWQRAEGFAYGRELTGAAIDRLLSEAQTGANVDEDLVYRRARHDGVELAGSHGTHVLDLAAGCDPYSAAAAAVPADMRELIVVQLPARAVQDTSGGWLALNVVDALEYVFARTHPEAKLVINLSYGAMAGPHDGSSALEAFIESLHARRPRDFALVLPAGNGFRSRGHARADVAAGALQRLAFDVRADDPTETFVELWHSAAPGFRVGVEAPDGTTLGPLAAGHDAAQGEAFALFRDAPQGGTRHRTVLCLGPASRLPGAPAAVPPGRWTLLLDARGHAAEAVQVDAWIERDEPVHGTLFPSRRQARFVAEHLPADAPACAASPPVDPCETLNSLAHGPSPIVVGAARQRDAPQVCEYSGCSVGRPVDVVALGDESAVMPGVRAAGTRSGRSWRMAGTSAAAPQVTRRIVALLQSAGAPLDSAAIRAALAQQARPVADACAGLTGQARRGAGFIDPT